LSDFLHWLRSYRQKDSNYLRWIFCGSIGLDTFTEKHNLSGAFNDVLPYGIGAFDESTAKRFLMKLGDDNDLPLNDDCCSLIIALIGWPLPFFLQAHFKQLSRLKNSHGNKNVTDTDINQAYLNIPENTPSLRSWEERLDMQLSAEESVCCKALLTAICKAKKGVKREKLFDTLYALIEDVDRCEGKLIFCLNLLERDGYILFNERVFVFRSPLLRDYWYKIKVK